MRIGIDACCWSNKQGYGRFTRELLKALVEYEIQNEYLFFVDAHTASMKDFPTNFSKIVVSTSQQSALAASAYEHSSIFDLLAMRKAIRGQKLDLFFFPSVHTYYPLPRRVVSIIGIHDVLAERYPSLVFRSKKSRFLWRWKLIWALKQSDIIVTVSEHGRRDIIQHLGVAKARIRIIPEAAAPIFRPVADADQRSKVLTRYLPGPEKRFLLYVGGISPHKNLDALIKVYAKLIQDQRFTDVVLLVVVDKKDVFHSNYVALQSMVDRMSLNQSVVFTGFVPDSDLVCLYSAAQALVLPSFDDGSGLAAIEAMACGSPVLTSTAGSLPEVVGDAGIFFDPHNPQEMQDALSYVLMDELLRAKMQQLGLKRAEQFSWKNSARELASIFNWLAQKKG